MDTIADSTISYVYALMLLGMLVYWPLQVAAVLATRGAERTIVLLLLAGGLLASALSGDLGPGAPNFPPWPWVVAAVIADVVLVVLVVRSLVSRFAGLALRGR